MTEDPPRDGEDWGWPALALLLCVLALLRPIDHDESQYVAAAVLTAHGLIPYRDYAYLQTPLQPFLLAPVAWVAGTVAWPALRLANALFGAVAIRCVHGAACEVADRRAALAATALFGCTDILLFAIGTARNDALPAACLAGAVWLAVRAERRRTSEGAALAAGLLLAAAAATKISYALPAVTYGLWALARHRHRPGFIALGALPVALFVAWTWWQSPAGFRFGVFTFPTLAPADYYAAQPDKLSFAAKLVDTAKFLALGPALPALALVLLRRRMPALLTLLLLAGLVAALLPTPTWRQYLLPVLPPLFVLLAHRWATRGPGQAQRIALAITATAGLAPTAWALASDKPAMITAMREGAAIARAMDAAHVTGPVATLSPQFLPATGRLPDARFATGPFFFRSHLIPPGGEAALHFVSRSKLATTPLPDTILIGGEGKWTSGDDRLDHALAAEAERRGYRATPIGRWRLYVRPRR